MSTASGFAYINSNNHEKDDFLDGLSAADVHTILYDLFNLKSPLQICKTEISSLLRDIAIVRVTEDFIIDGIDYGFVDIYCFNKLENELKGLFCESLPTEAIYPKMSSAVSFYLHILIKSGLIRQAGINWIFTKKAKQALLDKSILLKSLIEGVGYGISWKWFDNKDASEVGQLAFGISIILLLKYGDKYRSFKFYSEKYLRFFELVKDIPDVSKIELSKDIDGIYANRTFNCFARIFQFVIINHSGIEPMVIPSEKFTNIFRLG